MTDSTARGQQDSSVTDRAGRSKHALATNASEDQAATVDQALLEWLLDSDPAIRWQVLRDLVHAPAEVVAAERARTVVEGWGARLLALAGRRRPVGGRRMLSRAELPTGAMKIKASPGPPRCLPFNCCMISESIHALTRSAARWRWSKITADGSTPASRSSAARSSPASTAGRSHWASISVWMWMALVDRLLGEQLEDGGWNCEVENGSVRSSFATTINVLEGLLAHERATGGSAESIAARRRGEEYLLERKLFRRKSTGEVVNPAWLQFSFPIRWHYDVLRALEYFRSVGDAPGLAYGRSDRFAPIQAAARRHLAAGEHASRQGPLCTRGRRQSTQPMEHAAGDACPQLVRAVHCVIQDPGCRVSRHRAPNSIVSSTRL